MSIHRPNWLPNYIPELQGLRGLAVLAVFVFHCHTRLEGTWIHYASLWGWAGVNLFFVLSGFLITSILLAARGKPHYFRNFYGRRALRIWPVYILLLVVCYAVPEWFLGDTWAHQARPVTLIAYALLLQNLRHAPLPGTLGPTWSLAIEEQYYLLWAPLVRFIPRLWMLAVLLVATFIGSPLVRLTQHGASWMTPTHTLIHLDGIAIGSLLALGLLTLPLSRRQWLLLGFIAAIGGVLAAATIAGGTAFLDSALALAFAGLLLAAIASTGAVNPLSWLLRTGPLPFYGRISYGLYMIHILVFVYFGSFDARLEHWGLTGNLLIVALRLVATTLAATLLWYGFESQMLKLKRYF